MKFKIFAISCAIIIFIIFLLPKHCHASGFDMRYVPKGWATPTAGYWMTEDSGRMIASKWSGDVVELDIVSKAFTAYRHEVERSNAEQDIILKQLELEIIKERQRSKRIQTNSFMAGVSVGSLIVGLVR